MRDSQSVMRPQKAGEHFSNLNSLTISTEVLELVHNLIMWNFSHKIYIKNVTFIQKIYTKICSILISTLIIAVSTDFIISFQICIQIKTPMH